MVKSIQFTARALALWVVDRESAYKSRPAPPRGRGQVLRSFEIPSRPGTICFPHKNTSVRVDFERYALYRPFSIVVTAFRSIFRFRRSVLRRLRLPGTFIDAGPINECLHRFFRLGRTQAKDF